MADYTVLRRGLGLVRELVSMHPLPFTVSVTGALIYAGATVASTVVLGRVTDRVVLPSFETGVVPEGVVMWSALAVLAVTILRSSGVVARRYFAGMTSERSQRTLRRRLVGKYLGLPLSWHSRTPTGRLLAHADSDTDISTELIHPLPFSLGVGFLAVFSSISLIVIDLILAVVAFLIFPALTGMNRVYSRRIEEPAAAVQAGVGEISAIAHESFDGALVVKTLGRAGAESERFDRSVGRLRSHRVNVGFIRAAFDTVLDALPNLGIVAVLALGVFRIEAGAITRGDLVQVAALFTVLSLPMRVFGFFLEMIPPSVVARSRLETVFEVADPPGPTATASLPGGPIGLRAEALVFSHPRHVPEAEGPGSGSGRRETGGSEPAVPGSAISEANGAVPNGAGDRSSDPAVLRGVDLAVEPGEVVALVGSTGSGKSTLCHLLAGLIPADSGSIHLGGVPIDAVAGRERTDALALVFQESFLFGDTLRANIDLAGTATPEEVVAAAEVAQIHGYIDGLPAGYETVVGERGVTVSGGQRQRVALARALLRRPRLLILDDATSAVDPKVEQRILTALRSELAMTALVVAQRVSTIELADRVLYLADGRIAAVGTHRELMGHAGYEALVRAYEVASR